MEVTKEVVEGFQSLFQGRNDIWGSVEGRANKEPVTLKHYKKHLKGEVSLGVYPLLDDGTCRFLAIDLDRKEWDTALAIKNGFTEFGIPSYIAPSKTKGYHIYVFFIDWVEAAKARKAAAGILSKLKLICEIFPKQDILEPGMVGNYINLPYFGYTRHMLDKNQRNVPLDYFIDHYKPSIPDQLDQAISKLPKEAKAPPPVTPSPLGRLPCFEKMMQGVVESSPGRDEVAFRLAVHLFRQGMPQELALSALLAWDHQNQPSLGEQIIRQKTHQGYTGKYRLGCLTPIIQHYCDPACPIYRSKHLEREILSGETESHIGKMIKIGSTPPTYEVTFDGAKINLRASELLSLKTVKTKVFEHLNYVPFRGMKQIEWESLITTWGQMIEGEPAPVDAADERRYLECIYDWLESAPKAENEADVKAGRPIEAEDYYYFRKSDALHDLATKHQIRITSSKFWEVVRDNGGWHGVKRFGEGTFKMWGVPIRKEE